MLQVLLRERRAVLSGGPAVGVGRIRPWISVSLGPGSLAGQLHDMVRFEWQSARKEEHEGMVRESHDESMG